MPDMTLQFNDVLICEYFLAQFLVNVRHQLVEESISEKKEGIIHNASLAFKKEITVNQFDQFFADFIINSNEQQGTFICVKELLRFHPKAQSDRKFLAKINSGFDQDELQDESYESSLSIGSSIDENDKEQEQQDHLKSNASSNTGPDCLFIHQDKLEIVSVTLCQ